MKSNDTYKQKLRQALQMRSKAGSATYDRACLLVQVFDDTEFRADMGNADDFRAADALDEYCDDTAFKFLDLKTMLAAVPDKAEWSKHSLREIYNKAFERQERQNSESKPRRSVTVKDYDDLENRCKAAEQRAKHGQQMLDETRHNYDELLAENKRLRTENSELRGRILELERIVSRDFQETT